MHQGKPERLGELMNGAQQEFDKHAAPLCSELSSPKLHAVLHHPDIQQYVLGAKGVGSQGDGAAQLLCKDEEDMHAVVRILHSRLAVKCMTMKVPRCP
jgi:galactokinase